jgi:acyl carrier protein
MCDNNNSEHKKLKKILIDFLEIAEDTPDEEISQDFLETWDSAMHLNIVMEIESQFSIAFNIEDIIHMRSLEEISYYIDKKRT